MGSLKRRIRHTGPEPDGRFSSPKAKVQSDLVVCPTLDLEAKSTPRIMGLSGRIKKLKSFLLRDLGIVLPILIGIWCVLIILRLSLLRGQRGQLEEYEQYEQYKQCIEICKARMMAEIEAAMNNADLDVILSNSADQFVSIKDILIELDNTGQLYISSNMRMSADDVIQKLKQLLQDGKLKLSVVKKSESKGKVMELGDIMLLGYPKTDGREQAQNKSLEKPEGHDRDLLPSQFIYLHDTRI
ncbi:uncharacterized protein LOC131934772 [Physella acuta]|uniref:uncharacterized protein LOC131934772 n=1 Tax=Physella acuta TaxID=109671 RepID=UPI0027DC132D|nr:uncharacterized protein LOC131934772 [Physella acuta]